MTASIQPWSAVIDRACREVACRGAVDALLAESCRIAEQPLVERVYRFEDVGVKGRSWLDKRVRILGDEIKETYALAQSDHVMARTLQHELPILAAAYRITGETDLKKRTLAQLEELATWSPLQRPGWSLHRPGFRLPEDGKDGAWLATGQGVRALADTLEILPETEVPEPLRNRVHALLRAEIGGIVDDWIGKRPWFFRNPTPQTNQWVLPTEGLVRATLFFGKDECPDAHRLGLHLLEQALNAHGARGEFAEGVGYGSFTVTSLMHTVRALALADNPRFLDHPFIRNHPDWLIHHLQPGGFLVNAFDAFYAARGGRDRVIRDTLTLCTSCTGSEVGRWALRHMFGGPSVGLAGLAVAAMPEMPAEDGPLPYATYEHVPLVVWRDGWNEDSSGLWVRGGRPHEFHDHNDRGHVNFIAHGKPILIESGMCAYHAPGTQALYKSGAGHNVLQIGTVFPDSPDLPWWESPPHGWQKPHADAAIAVHRLDASGGELTVDASAGYAEAKQWTRRVTWSSTELLVRDAVLLEDEAEDIVLFRWHLGTEEDVKISGKARRWHVSWDRAEITLEADTDLAVSQERMPDHTLSLRDWQDSSPAHLHTCLLVQATRPVRSVKITTRVNVRPEA